MLRCVGGIAAVVRILRVAEDPGRRGGRRGRGGAACPGGALLAGAPCRPGSAADPRQINRSEFRTEDENKWSEIGFGIIMKSVMN